MMTLGKVVPIQCPGAMRDRYFLYPVVDGEGPHLGCNLGGLITRNWSDVNSACPTSSRAVNQTGRRYQAAHASLVFTASVPEGEGNKYANNVT